MNRQNFSTLTWFALAAIIALISSPAIAGTSPEPMNLSVTTFDLFGRELALPLPNTGLSREMPRFAPVLKVDVDGEDDSLPSSVVLLNEMWDWKSGFLSLHNRGSMVVNVVVHPAPPSVALECESELRQMLQAQLETELREFDAAGGQERYRPRLSVLPEPVQLDGAKALSYINNGYSDWESYIIPVTKRSYLSIDFRFFSGNQSEDSDKWRQLAEQLKASIVRGMRFRGDWISLQDCTK